MPLLALLLTLTEELFQGTGAFHGTEPLVVDPVLSRLRVGVELRKVLHLLTRCIPDGATARVFDTHETNPGCWIAWYGFIH